MTLYFKKSKDANKTKSSFFTFEQVSKKTQKILVPVIMSNRWQTAI